MVLELMVCGCNGGPTSIRLIFLFDEFEVNNKKLKSQFFGTFIFDISLTSNMTADWL